VFLLVLILIPFATEFAIQVSLESRTARNVTDQLLIENAIDGQFEVVLARLRYDMLQDAKTDSYTDEWNADEIRERSEDDVGVSLSTRAFDEQGKFNLRLLATGTEDKKKLAKERLARLLVEYRKGTPYELSEGEAETWAEQIFDYVNGRRNAKLPTPKRTGGNPIQILDELNFLDPVRDHRADWILHDQRKGEEVSPGLHRYVTVYGTGRLNLNTADVRVLRAYFSKNPDIADRIIERREGTAEDTETTGPGASRPPSGRSGSEEEDTTGSGGNPFTEPNQVNEVEGVTPELLQANQVEPSSDFDVKSAFFSFRIIAVTELTRRDELFVVERVAGQQADQPVEGFRFHLHQERTDALEEIDETTP
jgi:type II secretory pathway component PulK